MFEFVLDSEQAFDRLGLVDRTRVRRRRLAVTLIAASIGASWAVPAVKALGAGSEPLRVSNASYVVRQGDTLWSIAERLSPGGDPRPVVDALADVNHVDPGALVPGQTLVVPAGV
jgi:nucleoid-associated protein YgaU